MDAHFREGVHLWLDLPLPVHLRAMFLEVRRRIGVSLGMRTHGVSRIGDLAQRGQRGLVEIPIRKEGRVGTILCKERKRRLPTRPVPVIERQAERASSAREKRAARHQTQK